LYCGRRRFGGTDEIQICDLAACLLLSGCGALRETLAAKQAAQQAANDAADDKRCQSFGAKSGSDAYVQCCTSLGKEHADQQAAITAYAYANANSDDGVTPRPAAKAPKMCSAMLGGNTVFVQCSP
jgi:hypothetical protein